MHKFFVLPLNGKHAPFYEGERHTSLLVGLCQSDALMSLIVQKKFFLPTFTDRIFSFCLVSIKDPKASLYYGSGNGGSTLVALEKLQEKFGKSFTSRKTLIIHAGGFSQRFPTASVLGKVSTFY